MNWRTRWKVILASLANLLALSYIVYLTGQNFLFFVFFFIPVALCGWHLGRLSVFCMAVLSGMSWCVLDILSNHGYPSELFRGVNTLICFLAFATIGLLVQGLRQSLQEQLRVLAREDFPSVRLDDLRQVRGEDRLGVDHGVAEQFGALLLCRSDPSGREAEGGLDRFDAAWTKRINVEGRWVALDEFLTDQLNAKVTYGVSPEAMRDVLDNAQQAETPVAA